MSIIWLVSEGLGIVSGQGLPKVVYVTKKNTSSYEYIVAEREQHVDGC